MSVEEQGPRAEPQGSKLVLSAVVYSTAIVNAEGMTQRQIKGVHLEDAVRSPPSRHTARSGRLRQHWGQKPSPWLCQGCSDIQDSCRFG